MDEYPPDRDQLPNDTVNYKGAQHSPSGQIAVPMSRKVSNALRAYATHDIKMVHGCKMESL